LQENPGTNRKLAGSACEECHRHGVHAMSEEIPARKARQGRWGRPVLIVLVVGLILAAIAWWGAEMFGLIIEPDETRQID
jgi:hypothetical protein